MLTKTYLVPKKSVAITSIRYPFEIERPVIVKEPSEGLIEWNCLTNFEAPLLTSLKVKVYCRGKGQQNRVLPTTIILCFLQDW